MEQLITKKLANELIKMEGEIRGAVLKADTAFIIKEGGRESLEKVEDRMKSLGYIFKYDEIKPMKFYPIGLRVVSLLVIKEVLGFSDDKIKEMGAYVAKSSFVLRLSLRFLGFSRSAELYYKSTPDLWKKFVTTGDFKTAEFDEKEKKIVVSQIRNFNQHPILCIYMSGILLGFLEVARGIRGAQVKETKCEFQGDDYHEFVLSW